MQDAPKHGAMRGNSWRVAALLMLFAVAASIEDPFLPPPADAITGQVSIDGEGSDGVTVTLDGGAAVTTTGGGSFRFDDVEAGTHTIAVSDHPAGVRFERTLQVATIVSGGGAAAVNFFGSAETGLGEGTAIRAAVPAVGPQEARGPKRW